MRGFVEERAEQLREIALDLAMFATFAIAWNATRSIHEIAQWFPDVVTTAGMGLVTIKLVLDLLALTRPVIHPEPDEPRM